MEFPGVVEIITIKISEVKWLHNAGVYLDNKLKQYDSYVSYNLCLNIDKFIACILALGNYLSTRYKHNCLFMMCDSASTNEEFRFQS